MVFIGIDFEAATLMDTKTQKTQQLELHSAILTNVLDNVIQGVVMFGPAQRLLVWNTKFEDILKLPKSLLKVGTPIVEIAQFVAKRGDYGDGDAFELAKKRMTLYWNNQDTRSEISSHDDKVFDVFSHLTEEGSLVLTYTDITAHKEIEIALRDSETRFKDFTDAASDWYWELDENLRFKFITDAVMQYNGGIEPKEFYGKTRQELDIPADVSIDTWKRHVSDMENHLSFKNFEYSFVDENRMQHELSVSGRPIFDDDGIFTGYRGVGRDISKRKRMERSLRQHQQLLERQVVELRDREERLEAQAADLVSIAEELATAEGKMKFLANHDALTGLPSLRLCKDRIETAMASSRRDKTRFALMFIDLDGFKSVNDTLGHEAGDSVLKEVATRIKSHIREVDTVARIGGDEFVVIFSGLVDQKEVSQLADRLIKALSEPFIFNDEEALIGASIGISIYPEDDLTIDGLLRQADYAMYKIKQSGKNNFAFASEGENRVS